MVQTNETLIDNFEINRFHQFLTIRAGGGWIMVGYVLSIIGVAILPMAYQLELTDFWQGVIAAMALLGVCVGGIVGGWLTALMGRKILFYSAPSLILVASLGMLTVEHYLAIAGLRFMSGIAIGIEYTAAGALLAEFLPDKNRGARLSLLTVFWFVGAALAYIIGNALLTTFPESWRIIMASPAIIAGVLLIIRIGTPESPRWLMSKGRYKQAELIIKRVYGSDFGLVNVGENVVVRSLTSFNAILAAGYGKRVLFVVVFWTCAIIPVFAMYVFIPTIFKQLSIHPVIASWGGIAVTICFVLGCIAATWLINYIGRRTLILHSFLWSSLALLGLAIFPHNISWLVLLFFALYAFFIGGAQVLEFVYPNEIFPIEIRTFAVGIGASMSALCGALGTWLFPLLLQSYGATTTMLFIAAVTLLGLLISFLLAPETRGLTLQQSAEIVKG